MFMVFCLGMQCVGSEIKVLNLYQFIQELSRENLELLQENEVVEQAWQAYKMEKARHMPSAEFHVSWNRRKESNLVGSIDEDPVYKSIGPFSASDAKVIGRIPIWDASTLQDISAASKRVEIQNLTYSLTREELLAASVNQYLLLAKAKENLEAFHHSLVRDQDLLDLATSLFEAGASNKIDLIRAEMKLHDDEEAVFTLEIQVEDLELRLKRLLTMPLDRPVELLPFPIVFTDEAEKFEEQFEESLDKRADYQRSLVTVDKNNAERKAASRKRLPSLTFYGEYGLANQAFDGRSENSEWRALFLATVPIFDSKAIRSKERLALSKIRASELEVDRVRREVKRELTHSLMRIQQLERKIEISQRKSALARERYRLSKRRFAEGVADNQEAVEASLQLSLYDLNLSNTRYLYSRAVLDYCFAAGDVSRILSFGVN